MVQTDLTTLDYSQMLCPDLLDYPQVVDWLA